MAQRKKTVKLVIGVVDGEPIYWRLRVKDAKHSVKLSGTVLDAMKGRPGDPINCHMSETAKRNKAAFPHPVYAVVFRKTSALVITKIKNGQPSECVRYSHDYSRYVKLNDKDPSKASVKEHPEAFNRTFTLGPYHASRINPDRVVASKGPTKSPGSRTFKMDKNELARMKDAGLIHVSL